MQKDNQQRKKRLYLVGKFLSFFYQRFFQREDVPQKEFLENLGLLIVKNNLLIQFVENMWLKCLILHFYPKLNFPCKR
jgi:hypothetical protein